MKHTLFTAILVVGALTGCSKKDAAKATAGSSASASALTAAKPTGASAVSPSGMTVALSHLPAVCDAVLRIDVAGVFAVPAIKSQAVPALAALKTDPKDEQGKHFAAFLTDTGIDPATDLKEVAICFTQLRSPNGSPTITAALAGNFKPGTIIAAIEKNGKAEKFKIEELDGTKILVDEGDKFVAGQAADGALVMAPSKALLAAALKTSDAAKLFQIPTDVELSFVLTAEFMKSAMAENGNPFFAQASQVGRGLLALDLKKPSAQLRITMGDEKSATELAGVAKMLLGQLTLAPRPAGDPSAPMFSLLQAAKIESKGKDALVDIAISTEKLDELVKQLIATMKHSGPAAGDASTDH